MAGRRRLIPFISRPFDIGSVAYLAELGLGQPGRTHHASGRRANRQDNANQAKNGQATVLTRRRPATMAAILGWLIPGGSGSSIPVAGFLFLISQAKLVKFSRLNREHPADCLAQGIILTPTPAACYRSRAAKLRRRILLASRAVWRALFVCAERARERICMARMELCSLELWLKGARFRGIQEAVGRLTGMLFAIDDRMEKKKNRLAKMGQINAIQLAERPPTNWEEINQIQ